VKEHPILFSGPMVLAILDGRKTMTRRILKNHLFLSRKRRIYYDKDTERWYASFIPDKTVGDFCVGKCPYGQPGDRLWVREKFACLDLAKKTPVIYAADREPKDYLWRPSIHMPRWASRITLEIIAVRIERVQDISNEDAEAEGLSWCNAASPRDKFQCLWGSLNAKRGYGWDANPWVWAISFKRLP